MRRIAQGVAEGLGARAEVDLRWIFAPTVNNEREADFAAGVCSDIVGVEHVDREPPLIMASEDFSFMLEKVPGCYINIGSGGDEPRREVHSPGYDFNDRALPLGVSFFARLVEKRLR